MRILTLTAGWIIALLLVTWRLTCKRLSHDDPRPALRAEGRTFVYAILHAHQVAAMFVSDDKIGAMVSASKDGDLLAPSLIARGLVPARGSTRKKGQDKGGRRALQVLHDLMLQGTAVLLAVDGPRGPRGVVNRGAIDLAHDTGMPILPAMALANRRWVLEKAWDRFQVPKPFSRVEIFYGEPIEPDPDGDRDKTRERVRRALVALEAKHDPAEFAIAYPDGLEAALAGSP